MKICDLTQFYSPVSGGVKRYLHEKVAYVHERTSEDRHILIVPGASDSMTDEGRARTYTIRSPLVSRTSRYRALLRLEAVERILERERPDVIESGDPYQVAWKAVASGEAMHIPVVGFYHSHFPEAYFRSVGKFFGRTATEFVMDLSRRYVSTLYNRFARTLVPSPALAELLRGWGVRNVENIDLGVNTAVFKPEPDDAAATRAELGIRDGRVLLLYVGRLAAEKNTRVLFEAFEMLNGQCPGRFHLLAIGDGGQRRYLQELQRTTGAVTWLPYCADMGKLAEYYRAADLFVHPGVQETFGLVALESQACGTPVVGIAGSYMDRIIFNSQQDWAHENSGAALAQAIHEAADANLAGTGKATSRKVRELYSWTSVFDRLFAIYRQVVKDYRKP
ncbi:MAG: glycosyltransferase [Chthoniobacteraceae bacterium]